MRKKVIAQYQANDTNHAINRSRVLTICGTTMVPMGAINAANFPACGNQTGVTAGFKLDLSFDVLTNALVHQSFGAARYFNMRLAPFYGTTSVHPVEIDSNSTDNDAMPSWLSFQDPIESLSSSKARRRHQPYHYLPLAQAGSTQGRTHARSRSC